MYITEAMMKLSELPSHRHSLGNTIPTLLYRCQKRVLRNFPDKRAELLNLWFCVLKEVFQVIKNVIDARDCSRKQMIGLFCYFESSRGSPERESTALQATSERRSRYGRDDSQAEVAP